MAIDEVGVRLVLQGLSQFQGGMKSAGSALGTLHFAISGLKDIFGGVSQVMAYVQQAFDATTGETLKYAEAVREVSRVSGASAEESSKIIQVADDVKISTQTAETALRQMSKRGIAPTIDNLAQLSDEYRAIQDPTERSRLLMEKFGRSGFEMAKMLELGSDAIRANAKEAEALGLVLTEKDVKAARALEIATDNLEDRQKALSYTVGRRLIPAQAAAADSMNKFLSGQIGIGQFYSEVIQADYKLITGQEQLTDATDITTTALGEQADVTEYVWDATQPAGDAVRAMADSEAALAQMAADAAAAEQAQADAAARISAGLSGEYGTIMETFATEKKAIEDSTDSLEIKRQKLSEITAERDKQISKLIFEGALEEAKKRGYDLLPFEQLGVELGVLDEDSVKIQAAIQDIFKTAQSPEAAVAGIRSLTDSLSGEGSMGEALDANIAKALQLVQIFDALDGRTITTTVNTVYYGVQEGEFAGMQNTGNRQHGGAVTARLPYRVGEAGPERFIPSGPGYVLPATNISKSVNVSWAGNVGANLDAESIAWRVARRISREMNSL